MRVGNHFVVCVLLVVLPSCILGQRGSGPAIKKPAPAPAPVIPQPDPAQGNTGTGSISVKQAPEDEAMRHIEELTNAVSTMKVEKVQMQQSVNQLRMATINLQRTIGVMAAKISELDKLANQNKELTRMLTYFETFFGVLYSEAPEAFDSTIPVEERMSKMNTYLGNRDAVLAEMRPKPPVVQQPEPTGVTDDVARAVEQLGQDNARLASKVANLENDVANTNAEVEDAKAKAAAVARGGVPIPGAFPVDSDCDCGEDLEPRLEHVERYVETLVAANSLAQQPPVVDSSSSKKAGAPPVTRVPLFDERELELFRAEQAELMGRSVSNTRKSVFSAVRHLPMLGDKARQLLHFDSVHVNKGRNFKNNTVFQCTVEGFYFYHFTIRSYDGHYMGVALVKNSEMMTSVYTDASERSIMQSQSIVLHMQPGDEVWLELGSSERFAVHSDTHKYVTFSGFLIYKGR